MSSTSPLSILTEPVVPTDRRFAVSHRQELIQGFDQSKLAAARVVTIGAGGLGGEFGEGLCRKGVGRLSIFDHDVVDATNLNRQHFFRQDIGKNKGRCLAQNLSAHCHARTLLEGFSLSFQDALALGLDMSASLVVCGVDNGETRVDVSTFYRRLGIPVIFIAVDLHAECGHVFVQESTPGSPCFGCAFPESLVSRKAPCFVPSSKDILKLVVGLGLYAADSLLMDRRRNWNFRRVHLAGFAPDVIENLERNSGCPLCGNSEQGSPPRFTLDRGALPGRSPDPLP